MKRGKMEGTQRKREWVRREGERKAGLENIKAWRSHD